MSPAQAYLRPAGDKAHTIEVVVHLDNTVLHVIPWTGRKRDKEAMTLIAESMADKGV